MESSLGSVVLPGLVALRSNRKRGEPKKKTCEQVMMKRGTVRCNSFVSGNNIAINVIVDTKGTGTWH